MSLESLCTTHVGTFEKPQLVKDAGGGITYPQDQWEPVSATLTNIYVNIQPLSSRERMLFAQRTLTLSHRLYFPQDITLSLRKDYRFHVTKAINTSLSVPKYLIIKGIFNPAGQGRFTMVELWEQQ